MDTHAPVTYYQTALPPGHSMQYPSGRTTVGIGAMTPISMDSMGAQNAVYSTHAQAPPNDPNSGYSASQYHSVSTTPVPLQLQQYQQPASAQAHLQPQQQQQQQQQYMPMQTMVSTQPHSQVQPHLQHMQQQQPHNQQLQQQQITTTMHSNPHSHAYKQPTNGQQQYMAQTQQHIQQQHQQQTQHLQQQLQQQQYQQQHLQHHIQAQQAQQAQQQAQRQQILGPTVVTSHPTHHVQGHIQPVSHQQMHSQSSSKSQSQQHRHYQQQQQQHHGQHPSQQQRDHSRDHRNGNPATMEHVINPQTSTLQLAEFASVMVYTLWHTRPNINGASSNAYNVVPHRISVPPSAGPAFRKFCLKVLSATQLSSSVILLSLKYIQKLLKNNPSIHGQQGSEFRLFTVSLMLANKFLDDNTFTNKTWSDVTGISVKEINVMEMEFLNQVQFSLFVSEAEYLDWLHSLETWLKQQGQGQAQGTN